MTRDANVADRVLGRASALSRAALLLGTALAGGFYFTPTAALAACSLAGSTVTCTGNDPDGFSSASLFGGRTVNFDPAAAVFNPAGNGMEFALGGGLTFNMLNTNNFISASKDGIAALLGGGLNMTVNGDITASGGGISVTMTNLISQTVGATIILGADSNINALGGTGVSLTRSVGSNGSTTITANGTIDASGDGISYTRLLGSGAVTVSNNKFIGTGGSSPVGGDGIEVTQLAVSADSVTVNNSANGRIWATENGIKVTSLGDVYVNNDGNLVSMGTAGNNNGIMVSTLGAIEVNSAVDSQIRTQSSGGGIGMALIAGGDITVNGVGSIRNGDVGIDTSAFAPFLPASISGGVVALTGGGNVTIGDATNGLPGQEIRTAGGFGIFAGSLLGTVDINTTGADVRALNGTGVFGIATGDVNVKVGTVVAGQTGNNGFDVNLPIVGTLTIGGGAVALSVGGNATAQNVGKVDVGSGGTFGVAAISLGGSATATANAEIDPPAIGVAAISIGGLPATANVNALVQATTVGALAANIGSGNVIVNMNASGAIETDGIGILAVKVGDGNTTVTAQGPISGLCETSATNGVYVFNAPGDGNVLVDLVGSGATIDASNNGVNVIKTLGDGNITVLADGDIKAGNHGVFIDQSLGDGDVRVETAGVLTTTSGDGVNIVKSLGDGTVTVITNGVVNAGDDGIQVIRTLGSGDITVNAKNSITAANNGIFVDQSLGGGNVIVTTDLLGPITATNGDGVSVVKTLGGGDVTITANSTINAGDNGIQVIRAFGDGAVSVTATNNITAGDNGIFVDRHFGDGDVTVNYTSGYRSGNGILASDDGIQVVRTTGEGKVTVDAKGRIDAKSDGINVFRSGGDGANDVKVDFRGRLIAGDDGVQVIRILGDGAVDVSVRGRVNAGDDAVFLERHNGDGIVSVNLRGRVEAGDDGIQIIRTDGIGTVDVDFRGRLTAQDTGIDIFRAGDAGLTDIDVASRSRITAVNGDGIRFTGVNTVGDVEVDIGNRARVTAANGSAIDIITASSSGDNDVTINNSGRLVGKGSFIDPTVRVVADGNVTINNYGAIRSDNNDPSAIAVAVLAGEDVYLKNNRYIRGTVLLGSLDLVPPATAASTTFDNNGYWRTEGFSGFGAVNSVFLNNDGYIRTSGDTFFGFLSANANSNHYNNYDTTEVNGTLTIGMIAPNDANYVYNSGTFLVNGTLNAIGGAGMQFENDGGLVDMRFGAGTSDRVNISGDYIGGSGLGAISRLGIDTFLGGPGSPSDLMTVGTGINSGSTSGVTSVIVRDANYNGPGAYNPTGIDFVRVTSGNTQLGQFVLSPDSDHYDPSRGVLDKGLFFYDIATRGNGDGSRSQVLIGAPDREVFELSRATTAAQNIWHESAGVWLDRQADLRHQLMKQMVVAAPAVVSKGYDAPAPVFTTMGGAITPGAWLKAIGSWTNRDGAQKYSILDKSYSFNLDYKQDTYGVIGGLDFGMRGMHNQNDALVFGVLAGYLKSDVDFSASKNGYSYEGATVGLYATYLNNGFFADLLGKADLLKMSWSSPSLSGFVDSRGDRDANSYGFRLDSGYRYAFSPSMFIEPSATIAYVRTTIDSFDIPGGQINWQDGQSFRGALGLRVGGAFAATPAMTVEASLTGRIWNEFEGNNKVSIINPGPTFLATDNFDGAFGEVSGSLNIFGNNTGWSGFVNAGVKFNNELTTTTAKAGIRYVFGKAPAPAPVAAAPVLAVRY